MQLIEKTNDLEKFCADLANQPYVCVDLEFLREHTYFAKLCLIQIASSDNEAVIDPLANDINLQPFFDLMQNPEVIKVFHSGRQDIELIFQLGHCIPSPLFDTQIAASALGFGEAISYENLVKSFLNLSLDKSSRLSDWSKRPLSEEQQRYAIGDVTHLAKIYPLVVERLNALNRIHWIDEEIQSLGDTSLYQVNPDEIWQRMRHRSHSPKFLTLLRDLARWREKRAISKNVPRQSFIKDDILLNICAAHPQTKEELSSIRGVRKDLAFGKIGDEIIEVIKNFQSLSKDDYVTACNDDKCENYDSALLEILKMLLRIIAAEHNITPKLLTDEDELKNFCRNQDNPCRFMQGWRYEIFGKLAQKICTGNCGLTYNAAKHSINLIDC